MNVEHFVNKRRITYYNVKLCEYPLWFWNISKPINFIISNIKQTQ